MRRWYQNVDVEGAVHEDPKRASSKFWNEGKWHTFVEPLLPAERETFVDIGCNAGLHLKMAQYAGFKRTIGIEGNPRIMQQATQYREAVGGEWRLVPQVVGRDLDLYQLPLADVTLISNAHYYFAVADFDRLVHDLNNRTLYCIVVAGKAKRRGGRAFYDRHSVRAYYRDWTELGTVEEVGAEGDPAPRTGMYGVVFKSRLCSQDVDSFHSTWKRDSLRSQKFRFNSLPPALDEFFRLVLSGEEFAYADTKLWEYWTNREPNRSAASLQAKLDQKKALAEDVRDNGIREPLYFDHRGNLIDGLHRLCIAKELGHKHVVARRL
jgi:hypothetical protein